MTGAAAEPTSAGPGPEMLTGNWLTRIIRVLPGQLITEPSLMEATIQP